MLDDPGVVNDNTGPALGSEGGGCLPGGACEPGLVCESDTCVVDEVAEDGHTTDPVDTINEGTLAIFHNGSGPMCIAALDWLSDIADDHPGLTVEEHLTTDDGQRDILNEMKEGHETSQGLSTTFGYLPILFYQDEAFSGFDDDVAQSLLELMPSGSADEA